jgi:hypothetical protein
MLRRPIATLCCLVAVSSHAARFETETVPTPKRLEADWNAYRALLKKGGSAEPCKGIAALAQSKCIPDDQGAPIVVSAPPTVLAQLQKWKFDQAAWLVDDQPELEGLSWLPESAVSDGQQLPALLKALAGRNFGCVDGLCLTVQPVFGSSTAVADAQAVCERAEKIASAPPQKCVAIAARMNSQYWYVAWSRSAPAGGGGRPDLRFFLYYAATAQVPRLAEAMVGALQAPPWDLQIDRRTNALIAGSDRRPSRIAPRIREYLTIRADFLDDRFLAEQRTIVKFSRVELSTTLYTNELNTTAPEDWHMPTPEIEQRYLRSLHSTMKQLLDRQCAAPRWVDDFKVACGLPADLQLPAEGWP